MSNLVVDMVVHCKFKWWARPLLCLGRWCVALGVFFLNRALGGVDVSVDGK